MLTGFGDAKDGKEERGKGNPGGNRKLKHQSSSSCREVRVRGLLWVLGWDVLKSWVLPPAGR
jgi:hypothetical protein